MRKATFGGANVFLSRSLVAPEVFDAVHDALKLNGAQVFLCCDPDRNSPNDYHVISSHDHEKFEDLRSKGCNLLGPQCVLSCAKERRVLPKQGYTCCLGMDGVKVLASGFEREEKVMIGKLVIAMGGVLQNKASLDVNFVIVKNVLAAKYRYALNVLKKPIVNQSWLFQCWTEHRVVPQEPFRILPFTGLTICVTRIPLDERKEIQKLIAQNGGCYSADLTKKCTHLVSDAPVGDKYVVAQKWGHIHIVSRKWIDQCVAKRGCLDEGLYPVGKAPKSFDGMKSLQKESSYQEFSTVSSQTASRLPVEDLETTVSQNIPSSVTDAKVINNDDTGPPKKDMEDEPNYDSRIAEDSETEDDLYLSNCRMFLVGFEEKEQSKLVNMIRKGGGTRHMLLTEKLTHIILGAPSESEKREVRRLAAWGVINVVKSSWLEECDQARRELPVLPKHIVSEVLIPKDSARSGMERFVDVPAVKKAKSSTSAPFVSIGRASEVKLASTELISGRSGRDNSGNSVYDSGYAEVATKYKLPKQLHAGNNGNKRRFETGSSACAVHADSIMSSGIFKGKKFYFPSSFPMEQRPEVIGWIKEGEGLVMEDDSQMIADLVVQRHGFQFPIDKTRSTVSTHWIYASLQEGCMLDITSHILYSPLRCHTPLPGFEVLRFCVSQYEEKDRLLLKNLCFVLGAKFSSSLTRKVTHLLCKFTNGPKYEAAYKWGIQPVTAEWITECITQDKIVPPDPFQPRAVTAQDKEAGLCIVSQYPTQAARMMSGCAPSQPPSQSQHPVDNSKVNIGSLDDNLCKNPDNSSANGKRSRLPESSKDDDASKKSKFHEDVKGGSRVVPDWADAIEDLLAQSDKIQDMKSPGTCCSDQIIFSSNHSPILGQNDANPPSTYGIARHWLNRTEKQESKTIHKSPEVKVGTFDNFSETQSDSQVVMYEEDLTGRQKIIDRVRFQGMTLTPDK